LCDALPGRFTLQLHDLNFLPGTDIAAEALKRGMYTPEQLDALMYAPMEQQYATWWESACDDPEKNFWYHLIYMTQFPSLKKKARALARNPDSEASRQSAAKQYANGKRLAEFRRYRQKGMAVIKSRVTGRG